MTYKCLADLQGKTLELRDTVVLNNIFYTVYEDCLAYRGNSGKIFQVLGISKSDIVEQAYGYPPFEGNWPRCKKGDYRALTRLVIVLYKIIEKASITYKITTPGKTGISPEQVKELIIKYGGRIAPNYNYRSEIGTYYWKKGELVDVTTKLSIYAIEVSPITEITITKKEEKHETKFQRKKACIKRGTQPKGNTIRGRRSKASIAVGHLSYRKVTGV